VPFFAGERNLCLGGETDGSWQPLEGVV
jgi:hypothetical protein